MSTQEKDISNRKWLPVEAQIIDKEVATLLDRKREIKKWKERATDGKQILRYNEELHRINERLDELRMMRQRTSDGINSHVSGVVADALGVKHRDVWRRILDEAVSRANGGEHKIISIFPDSHLDELAQLKSLREAKMSAEAKVHRVRKLLEESKLSMSGTMIGSEYDRRKNFNNMIDKLLFKIANA